MWGESGSRLRAVTTTSAASSERASAIRVLHLRDTYEVGGPGKTIMETISHINAEAFLLSVGVFAPLRGSYVTPFTEEARRRGVSIHEIRGLSPFDPLIAFRIERLVKLLKIDIVHTHETLSNVHGIVAARRAGVRAVATIHGWIENSFMDRVRVWMDKKLMRRFDKTIVVSEAMRRQVIQEGVPAERVAMLHNCIVSSKYRPDGSRGHIERLVGRRLERPIFGSVGRLSPEKGHKDFITAAAMVVSRGQRATFVLAGDGPERQALERMAAEMGIAESVHFLGHQADIGALYNDLDAMVLPSYTEGLPNVVLESLLMETPVIATDVGGTAEIVHHRDTGVLVEKQMPEEIAGAMVEFMESPATFLEMARAGRAHVLEEFNFAARTRRLERIYSEVMRRPKSSPIPTGGASPPSPR